MEKVNYVDVAWSQVYIYNKLIIFIIYSVNKL